MRRERENKFAKCRRPAQDGGGRGGNLAQPGNKPFNLNRRHRQAGVQDARESRGRGVGEIALVFLKDPRRAFEQQVGQLANNSGPLGASERLQSSRASTRSRCRLFGGRACRVSIGEEGAHALARDNVGQHTDTVAVGHHHGRTLAPRPRRALHLG
jgi:hypothetical protein